MLLHAARDSVSMVILDPVVLCLHLNEKERERERERERMLILD
jgi:hypothetical protein